MYVLHAVVDDDSGPGCGSAATSSSPSVLTICFPCCPSSPFLLVVVHFLLVVVRHPCCSLSFLIVVVLCAQISDEEHGWTTYLVSHCWGTLPSLYHKAVLVAWSWLSSLMLSLLFGLVVVAKKKGNNERTSKQGYPGILIIARGR